MKRNWKRNLASSFTTVTGGITKKERRRRKIKRSKKRRKLEKGRKAAQRITDSSKGFYASWEWRKLRMRVLLRDGAKCMCCGATREDGVKICVDHIKPIRRFPLMALDINNLQILCDACNHGKGSWDSTNWRNGPPPTTPKKTKPQPKKPETVCIRRRTNDSGTVTSTRLVIP